MKLNVKQFEKFLYVSVGGVAGFGAYFWYNQKYSSATENLVSASWTTNYEPTVHAKWDYNWDRRGPDSVQPKLARKKHPDTQNDSTINNDNNSVVKPTAYRHILLIRHGQYNLKGSCDSERILTALGRNQASYTGKRLALLGLPYTALVKSTMARAQETANIIAGELNTETVLPGAISNCDLIREGSPVPPEPPLHSWKQEMSQFYVDGARIEAAFRKYFHRADVDQTEDSYTVLVCHANVIRYFVCRALQFPAEGWLRISLNHASITWISITPSGRVVLRCLGDSGHMPPDLITSH